MPRRFYNWFVSEGDTVTLAYFRIAVALFCLLKIVVVQNYLLDIYGQYGYVQWAITKANLFPGLPHLGDLAIFLGKWGVNADSTVFSMVSIYCISAIFLCVGFLSRIMATIIWFINFIWMHSGGGLTYGMDIFHHISLFYCIVMPVGSALSVEKFLKKDRRKFSLEAGVSRHILQIHMCIMYTSSGFEKAMGQQWWNGEAIWRSLMLPIFHNFDMSWLAQFPRLAMVLGWGVLATEISYGVVVWIPRVRILAVGAIILMHVMIGIFLGLQLFALIMIILNVGAFGTELREDFQSLLALKRVRKSSLPPAP